MPKGFGKRLFHHRKSTEYSEAKQVIQRLLIVSQRYRYKKILLPQESEAGAMLQLFREG